MRPQLNNSARTAAQAKSSLVQASLTHGQAYQADEYLQATSTQVNILLSKGVEVVNKLANTSRMPKPAPTAPKKRGLFR